MIAKYKRVLINRETNPNTGETWKLQDVPGTWRSRTEEAVIAAGYKFDKNGVVEEAKEDK